MILYVLRCLRFLDLRQLGFAPELHRHQDLGHFCVDHVEHQCEQLECLLLVFLGRRFLCIAPQMDALAQMVERREVLAPVRIDTLQHDCTLELADCLRVKAGCLVLVLAVRVIDNTRAQLVLVEIAFVRKPLLDRQFELQLGNQRFLERVDLPLLFQTFRRNVLGHEAIDHLAANRGDALRDVGRFEQLVARLVDRLALVVGNIVVFEQVLAHVEVAGLDFALRVLDRTRHPRMLDRLPIRHFEPLHDRCDAV